MLTKNNWYTSNIKERLKDPSTNLKVDMNLYPFEMMDFNSAAKMTAIEISKNFDNLYLAYSGGYDSDFILRLFVGLGLPVTPVIVMLGNEKESSFALETCKELNVVPDIINLSESEFLNTLFNKTMTINGQGVNNVQTLTVAEYVNNKNGVLLTGNHLIGDDGSTVCFLKGFSTGQNIENEYFSVTCDQGVFHVFLSINTCIICPK